MATHEDPTARLRRIADAGIKPHQVQSAGRVRSEALLDKVAAQCLAGGVPDADLRFYQVTLEQDQALLADIEAIRAAAKR